MGALDSRRNARTMKSKSFKTRLKRTRLRIAKLLCMFVVITVLKIGSVFKRRALRATQHESATGDLKREVIKSIPHANLSSSNVHLAVIIPFLKCQVARLTTSLSHWDRLRPCSRLRQTRTSLIFHYNKYADPVLVTELISVWDKLPHEVADCFDLVEIWSADLSEHEDTYPLGPCLMFHRTFLHTRKLEITHWLQYEPDVIPIRKGWLDKALQLVEDNSDCAIWWQLGSEPAYDSPTDYLKTSDGTSDVDLHINGNALYCSSSEEFANYRRSVRISRPPMGCYGDSKIGEFNGHDHSLYRFRHTKHGSDVSQHIHYKFRLDPFIRNFGASSYDISSVLRKHPATYLVHGKYTQLSVEDRITLRLSSRLKPTASETKAIHFASWQAIGLQPTRNELLFWLKVHMLLVRHGLPRDVLVRTIYEAWNFCDSRTSHPNTLKYFISPVQLAITSSFLKVLRRLPGPSEIKYIESEMHKASMSTLFSNRLDEVCKMSRQLACSQTSESLLSLRASEQCVPTSFNRLISNSCIFISGDENNLHVRCNDSKGMMNRFLQHPLASSDDSTTMSLRNAAGCLTAKVRGSTITCTSRYIWQFDSATPFVRGDKQLPARQYFARQFSEHYPETKIGESNFIENDKHEELGDEDLTPHSLVWTTDFHAGPAVGNMPIFAHLNVHLDARIDFGNCMYFKDELGQSICATSKNLKVLANNDWAGFGLHPCPKKLREEFYYAYRNDHEFARVRAVICSHPVANCELYMPFNKSIVLYFTVRLEFGRNDKFVPWRKPWIHQVRSPEAWSHWIDNFMRIASKQENAILANNVYDAKYVEYFTGVKPVIIPSWSGPNLTEFRRMSSYRPSRVEILLTPYRSNLEYRRQDIPPNKWPKLRSEMNISAPLNHPIFDDLFRSTKASGIRLMTISAAFPNGYKQIADLREFPILLFIPYQASVMSFFELYRLNIPMLVPSEKLLITWMRDHRILFERVYGDPVKQRAEKYSDLPSPNSFLLADAAKWIPFYDIYQRNTFPHLLYFDSWDHALQIAKDVDLNSVSGAMRNHNMNEFYRISGLWRRIFEKIDLQNRKQLAAAATLDFDQALWQEYATTAARDSDISCKAKIWRRHTISVDDRSPPERFSKCETRTSPKRDETDLHIVSNGEYAKTCLEPRYDAVTDRLTCDFNGETSELYDPYSCADIRVTMDGQLLCI